MKKLLLVASLLAISGISSANIPAEKSPAEKFADCTAEIFGFSEVERQELKKKLDWVKQGCAEGNPNQGDRDFCMAYYVQGMVKAEPKIARFENETMKLKPADRERFQSAGLEYMYR
jgi:hypothetical protein